MLSLNWYILYSVVYLFIFWRVPYRFFQLYVTFGSLKVVCSTGRILKVTILTFMKKVLISKLCQNLDLTFAKLRSRYSWHKLLLRKDSAKRRRIQSRIKKGTRGGVYGCFVAAWMLYSVTCLCVEAHERCCLVGCTEPWHSAFLLGLCCVDVIVHAVDLSFYSWLCPATLWLSLAKVKHWEN